MSKNAVPRYLAVERHLRSRLASLKPGDPVGSDAELCALFNVSRMTVRQAVLRLVTEELIYRVPGVGTFVARPQMHRHAARLRSFTEELGLRGAGVSSRMLVSESRDGTVEEIADLKLPPRSIVVHVRRLRLADDEPMAIEDVVLPPFCTPVLDADLEHGSLHEALKRLGEIPTKAVGMQFAATADPSDADLLEIGPGAPMFVERRLITNQNALPLEKTETRYVGDRFVFHIELSR